MDTIQLTPKQSAFITMVWDRHHERLLLYAVGLCRRYFHRSSLANDLLQETYLKICESYEVTYTGYHAHGVPYLCQIVKNCLFDAERKFKSFDRVESIFVDRMPKISTIDSLCYDIGHQRFYEYIEDCLSERDADVMKFFLDGFKHREIAVMMNIKQNTVSTIVRRSKQALAKYFKSKPQNSQTND